MPIIMAMARVIGMRVARALVIEAVLL